MRTVFVDSSRFIAILNPNDGLHQRALDVSRTMESVQTVTTEMVLVEVLNYFACYGAVIRERAERTVRLLRSSTEITVFPQSSELFGKGLNLYAQRPDKEWSVTDCASFVTMQEFGTTEALTHDHHFVQAGYAALLREPS